MFCVNKATCVSITVYRIDWCIDLFSCTAARVFNKLTYLLTYCSVEFCWLVWSLLKQSIKCSRREETTAISWSGSTPASRGPVPSRRQYVGGQLAARRGRSRLQTTVVVDGKLHTGAVWLECLPQWVSNHHATRDTHWLRAIVELVMMERNPAATYELTVADAKPSSRFHLQNNFTSQICRHLYLFFGHTSKRKPHANVVPVSVRSSICWATPASFRPILKT